jgi:choline-glycine betaine transporter
MGYGWTQACGAFAACAGRSGSEGGRSMLARYFGTIRPVVFYVPMGILAATVLASMIDLAGLVAVTSAMNGWILAHFADLFSWGSFAFVITCLWALVSPLGGVRIGGPEAKPLLSRWSWFSITLCTTIAIGILFWATAEPMFHLHQPPAARGLVPGSEAAARFAMTSLFMHWSFTPYAIYTVPGLAFALAYYNLGRDYSLSGPLSLVIGRLARGVGADLIDTVALFALIAGIAATLGAGMMSIAGGIATIGGFESGPLLQAGVTVAIVVTFVVSSITGLQRGIRVLSDINTKFFFLLALFVLLAGPTGDMLMRGLVGLWDYAREFLPRSLGTGPGHDALWSRAWTVFYWANWLAWAPVTALFLGRIARGYTVRSFILVNFIGPSLFAIAWMTIFGGAALEIDMGEGGTLGSLLTTSGPEAIAYAVLARYPFAAVLMVVFVFLSFISYVTAADSNTEAIASVCRKDAAHDSETVDSGAGNIHIKATLAVFIGAAAWAMTAFSGIDGVRMMSNLGGFPALVLVVLMNAALIVMGTRYLAQLRRGRAGE